MWVPRDSVDRPTMCCLDGDGCVLSGVITHIDDAHLHVVPTVSEDIIINGTKSSTFDDAIVMFVKVAHNRYAREPVVKFRETDRGVFRCSEDGQTRSFRAGTSEAIHREDAAAV